MSGINSVKNYKYSILIKKIGVLKRLEKTKKSLLVSAVTHTTDMVSEDVFCHYIFQLLFDYWFA